MESRIPLEHFSLAPKGRLLESGLYIVSTPIGNLKDITIRALEVLKDVDLIACEDTRHTGILLKNYNISNRLISFYEYNKLRRTPEIIQLLKQGKRVALVSCAGTPGISDPGFYLIRAAIENSIKVIPIPGPSALLAGLTISGLSTDRFVFEGFLPKREGRKKKKIAALKNESRTIVFYESSLRLPKTLNLMANLFGVERKIVIARELTKKFEEVLRGSIGEILTQVVTTKIRGEVVIIVEGGRSDA